MGFRDHVAADAGGDSDSLLRALHGEVPKVADLAQAPIDDVLSLWTGLGYYARARNLHKTACIVAEEYGGEFPDSVEGLESLPGIGRSTAGAILTLGHGGWAPILDGNVKRVLARYHAIEGWPGRSDVLAALWKASEAVTPQERTADYTQGIMDLGATLCTKSKPECLFCPMTEDCQARISGTQAAYPGKKLKKRFPPGTPISLSALTLKGGYYSKGDRRAESGAVSGHFPRQAISSTFQIILQISQQLIPRTRRLALRKHQKILTMSRSHHGSIRRAWPPSNH